MTTRTLVFPHVVEDGLALRIADPRNSDGVPLEKVTTSNDKLSGEIWDFVDATPAWSGLELELSLEVSNDMAGNFLPAGGSLDDDIHVLVSIMCTATNYRRGVRLERASDTLWRGDLLLHRDDLFHTVYLTPTVVRRRDAAGDVDDRYGKFAGAVLATGRTIELVVDRVARRFDGSIAFAWEDFATSDDVWRKERRTDVFHLDPGQIPTITLNLRWPFLKPMLDFHGQGGTGAASRDLATAAIAQSAWIQLLATAVASIQAEEDEYFVSGEQWREDIVLSVLPELYPDISEPSARLARAYAEWREAATAGVLVCKLGALAQSRGTTLGKLMDRAVKAMDATLND